MAVCLNNLASLLKDTNRLGQADPLMRRMVEIMMIAICAAGHEHPSLKAAVIDYSLLLHTMGRSPEQIRRTMAELSTPLSLKQCRESMSPT